MISVCMATYNGEKFIKEQLESILNQLGDDDEIVISDDGSTDNTITVIHSLHDKRIKVFYNHYKHGFTRNFENALRHANGDVVFLSDQDDIWVENKVNIITELLKEYDLVIHDCKTVNYELDIIQESRFDFFSIKPGFMRHLIKSRYLGCCMAFNRNVLNATLPFPANETLVEHDIWIAAVGWLYFKTFLLKQPLILYRRHGNNVSDGGFDKGYSIINKIHRRLYRLYNLIKIRKRINK